MSKTKIGVTNQCDPYVASAVRSVESDKYWRWGDDNLLPEMLSTISRRAVTHRRIINDKADYITGKGVAYDNSQPLIGTLIERVNAEGESLRQIINRIAFDKMLFANAFVELVRDARHTTLAIYHHDASTCRVAKDSKHIILHHDWRQFNSRDAKHLPIYPLFESQEDGTERSMLHYKDYEPTFTHYGVPNYIAGLNVSMIAYKTDKWNISRLDNSFQMSGVMLLDDAVDAEDEAERIIRTAEEKFGGKPGQVLFVLKDGTENDNSRFIPLSSTSDGDWAALHTQANSDIVVAHSWFRSLSGLDYTTGFSAERILNEYEVALNTVILGEQDEILEPLREAFTASLGVDCSSISIINRPPTNTKPNYMMVWEARKADGLDYDKDDARQQIYLSQTTNAAAVVE